LSWGCDGDAGSRSATGIHDHFLVALFDDIACRGTSRRNFKFG
jgi:hypothetical protein